MRLHGYRALFGLAGLIVSPATAAATPPEGAVTIYLEWSGDQPTAVALGGAYPPTALALNPAHTAFEAHYAVLSDKTYLKALTLNARYGDGSEAAIPVRLWPQLPGLTATVYHITPQSCLLAMLEATERPAGTIEGALKAYFTARALYQLGSDDQCSRSKRKRAAKAWFDRAYELTQLRDYFDLSGEAAAAYAQYDPAYVQKYKDQARGGAIRLVNNEKIKALQGGQYVLAAFLNDSLLKTFNDNPQVAAVSRDLQSLPEAQLEADRKHIAAKAAAADDAPHPLMASMPPSAAAIPHEM